MKSLITLLLIAVLALTGLEVGSQVLASYKFENTYSQLWQLADKSSTIPAKQQYVEQFANKLQEGYAHGDFASHNAIWLQTPNNSFEQNLKALKTLSTRLTEIQGMDPTSFQYNTAIQQITAQEQGESHQMLSVFSGCYELSHYPLGWDWIAGTLIIIDIALALFLVLLFGITVS